MVTELGLRERAPNMVICNNAWIGRHFIKDAIENEELTVKHVGTDEMAAVDRTSVNRQAERRFETGRLTWIFHGTCRHLEGGVLGR